MSVDGIVQAIVLVLFVVATVAIGTAFWFFFGNWFLSVFNLSFRLNWGQALAVWLAVVILANLLGGGK